MGYCSIITGNLFSVCGALNAAGGVKEFAWILEDVKDMAYVLNANGGVSDITLDSGIKLIKVSGKRLTNSGNATLVKSEDRRTFSNHEVKFGIYVNDSAGMTLLNKLTKVQSAVIFLPLLDGTIRAYGMDFGMQVTAFESTTGVKLEDNIAKMFTFSDTQLDLPLVVDMTASELDALAFANSF